MHILKMVVLTGTLSLTESRRNVCLLIEKEVGGYMADPKILLTPGIRHPVKAIHPVSEAVTKSVLVVEEKQRLA